VSAAEQYDPTLTDRLREGLAALADPPESNRETTRAAFGRLEARIRSLLPAPEVDRVLALLHPASTSDATSPGPTTAVRTPEPMSHSASEMLELSRQLDAVSEPTQALAIGERVARRAHEIARGLDSLLTATAPGDLLSEPLHRMLAFASELVRNALARIRQFAAALGVSSVAVTLATFPPEFEITFTFGPG
jgi:hypothetical protein